VSDRNKDSELYKEVKAIVDEMLEGIGDKIAYLVCKYKTAAINLTQPEKLEEKSFLAKIDFKQKDQLKDFCKENKIGCSWFAERKSWKVYSDKEQLLTKAREYVLTELKGKIF